MAERTSGRIITTQNVNKNLTLAKLVYSKHQQDGKESFLHLVEGEKWETVGPTIDQAEAIDKEAQAFKRKAEEKFAQRDLLLKPIVDMNNKSKKLLKGKYASNPKKLGEWGYEVDDTPPKARVKKGEK